MKLTDMVGVACFGIALVILWQFRQIVLLMFAAVVIAIALNGLVRYLSVRRGWGRRWAVLATTGLAVVASLIFLGLVLPLFISQFQELIQLIPMGFERISQLISQFLETPPDWFPSSEGLFDIPDFTMLLQQATSIGTTVFGNFFSFFSSSVAIVLQMLLLLVLSLMMLSDPRGYRTLFLRLFPSHYRRRADDILTKCEAVLLNWLRGVAVNSAFVATVSFTGLVVLDVDFAFTHAMIAGVFNFIPNLGPALSAVFPIFVALLDNPIKALLVLVLYVIIQNLESYWISPMVMQKQVSLLPAATLVAQIFFATFLGPLGLILALPLAVTCKTWIEEAWIVDVLDRDPAQGFALAPAKALPEAADPQPDAAPQGAPQADPTAD